MARWRSLGLLVVWWAATACVHVRGSTAADVRGFAQSPSYGGQAAGHGVSLKAEPEAYVRSSDEAHTGTVRPFVRVDPVDTERTHYDVRQADYRYANAGWSFGIGAGVFDWGVMENYRTVDVINQKDLVEDLDGSEKLGQPYTKAGYDGGRWSLSLFYLPYFRDRTFPGPRGRLRFPAVVDTRDPFFESALGRWHPNVAARLSLTLGEFDVGLTGFSGTSREPRFFGQLTDDEVIPGYDFLEQVSVDAQWTHGGLVAKTEAIARWWSATLRLSGAVAAGLEYWFFDLGGKGVDLTVLSEFYWDSRLPDQPITFYDRDIFGGFRLGFSDLGATEVLGGAMTDIATGFSFLRLQTSRRFGVHWRLYLDLRSFVGRARVLESALRRDSYGQLRVAYFF